MVLLTCLADLLNANIFHQILPKNTKHMTKKQIIQTNYLPREDTMIFLVRSCCEP